MFDLPLIIGTSGMLFLLTAFVLDLLNKITQESALYNIFNIIGAGLLFYYALTLNSIPFSILQAAWAGFAIYKLATIMKKIK